MLTLKNRPPQHEIDTVHEWIHPEDPAWDNDTVDGDRARLTEAAIKLLPASATEEQKAEAAQRALTAHPVLQWYACRTRYSLTAMHTVPERLRTGERPDSAVPITAYMLEGRKPTRWILRPLGARTYRRIVHGDNAEFHLDAVAHGLVRIETGDGETIEPDRDKTGKITEEWLDWLDQQDRSWIPRVGAAVYTLCNAKEDGAEGKP